MSGEPENPLSWKPRGDDAAAKPCAEEATGPLSGAGAAFDLSILIVSFNTREVLRECLETVRRQSAKLRVEILVVDNNSSDGSPEMIEQQFPEVRLTRSSVNLGFGGACNSALGLARGKYIVLLNSDAFLQNGALDLAVAHMNQTPLCGLGGGRLIGRDGAWQPSARSFHSIAGDAMMLTGLAARFPKSRIFGSFDRTWADAAESAQVDWVPGAFAIIRPEALAETGPFDQAFFLYYEEVDLCLRMKKAGWSVWYWPDIVVVHIGGESSRQMNSLEVSAQASQVVLWRMRSTLLYYRKHHGAKVHAARWLETTLYLATVLRNKLSRDPRRRQRGRHCQGLIALMRQAWKETHGGRVSPPQPW